MVETPFLTGFPVEVQIIIRIMVAYLIAAVIGWEREQRERGAGLRTHMLVATGAAVFTVTAIYGFGDPNATVKDAAGRIVAQIITGVGFLGAGVIWHSTDQPVKGLTTAAGIWLTAAIGVMAGVGMLFLAVFVGGLSWFTLRVLKRYERRATHVNRQPIGVKPPIEGAEGVE